MPQSELETFLGVSAGKYTIGLGQQKMSFCDDREGEHDTKYETPMFIVRICRLTRRVDIYSMALTTVSSLLRKYSIDPNSIGRLEVGSETLLDKSKSCKSVLMQLFGENTDIEGVDTVNACYGGINALINSVNWVESSAWDGRDALVVAGDIALYDKPAARPTGGAGCVAIVVGPDAPLVLEPVRASYMKHVYDFYKPDFKSEYPIVDGQLSNTCYLEALDKCYQTYRRKKLASKATMTNGVDANSGGSFMDTFDYMAFHTPYCKLVAKGYGRLLFNDFRSDPKRFDQIPPEFREIEYTASLTNKNLEKLCVGLTKDKFSERVQPSVTAATNCGNMYTASVYSCLVSLLSNVPSAKLQNKRIGLYSYGGGLASSMISFQVKGDTSVMAQKVRLHARLDARTAVSPEFYNKVSS